MVKQKSHHVVPNPDGGWDVKKAAQKGQANTPIPNRKRLKRPDR